MNLYDRVKIIGTGETGFIVEISPKNEKGPAEYLVEKSDKYKDGKNDITWVYENEIERV